MRGSSTRVSRGVAGDNAWAAWSARSTGSVPQSWGRRGEAVDVSRSTQKRFAHLFQPEADGVLDEIQRRVSADWQALLARCGELAPA